MVLSVDKYGNDIEWVDTIVADMLTFLSQEVEKYPTTRTGRGPTAGGLETCTSTISANVFYGKFVGATPDGRLQGEPTSDGISPNMGRDTGGPTTTLKSVGKLPHVLVSGGQLLNQKFSATNLSSDQARSKFAKLIRGYSGDMKGMQIQINVVDAATLRDAQEHPENYPNLLIRVAGYTALFTQITRELQDAIIARTEQAV
jgi:formate C-acetyltransferase